MKKVIALAVMIGFLSINAVSYAYFDRRVDSFDETVRLYSIRQNVGDFVQFNFFRVDYKEKNANIRFLLQRMC